MAQPPSKKPTLLSSNIRIDDPTAAFPIGGLAQAVEERGSEEPPATPATGAASTPKPAGPSPRGAGSPYLVAGVDLRWVLASLVGGAFLAVLVVVGLGSIAILIR